MGLPGHKISLVFRRNESKDEQIGGIEYTGYDLFWPSGCKVRGLAFDRFCKIGVRYILGREKPEIAALDAVFPAAGGSRRIAAANPRLPPSRAVPGADWLSAQGLSQRRHADGHRLRRGARTKSACWTGLAPVKSPTAPASGLVFTRFGRTRGGHGPRTARRDGRPAPGRRLTPSRSTGVRRGWTASPRGCSWPPLTRPKRSDETRIRLAGASGWSLRPVQVLLQELQTSPCRGSRGRRRRTRSPSARAASAGCTAGAPWRTRTPPISSMPTPSSWPRSTMNGRGAIRAAISAS